MTIPFPVPIRGIEPSQDYKDFIQKLEDFHHSRGLVFEAERLLGGIKIDLLKFAKLVEIHGGYAKVTSDRAWKKIASYFDFSSSCTNGAYSLKRLYSQTIFDYVQADSGMPALATPVKEDDQIKKQLINRIMAQLYTPGNNTVDESTCSEDEGTKKRYSPHSSIYFEKGRKSRILLAVEAGLPNEFDWAMNELVPLSVNSELMSLAHLPHLVDDLLSRHLDLLRIYLKMSEQASNETLLELSVIEHFVAGDTFSNAEKKYRVMVDRLHKTILIVRNISLNRNNHSILSKNSNVKELIHLMSSLPLHYTLFDELHRYCLDLTDNLGFYFHNFGSNQLVEYLTQYSTSADAYCVSGCFQALSKIFLDLRNIEYVHFSPCLVRTALQLLLTKNDYLRSVVLDFWEHYVDIVVRSQKPFPIPVSDIVRAMLSFISHELYTYQDQSAFPLMDRNTRWLISNYQLSQSSVTFSSIFAHYKWFSLETMDELFLCSLIRKIYPSSILEHGLPSNVYLKRKKIVDHVPIQTATRLLLELVERDKDVFYPFVEKLHDMSQQLDEMQQLLWLLV